MGQKAGISRENVVAVAAEIADRDGIEAATLSAVARKLGIKTPSLYSHVDGVDGLRRQLAIMGSKILLDGFRAVVERSSGADALREIARVDRRFALEHPGLYASFLPAPGPEDDPELYEEMAAPVFVVASILLDMGIPTGEAIHLVRALRSMLHGFLDLEAKAGFGMPVDIDTSFEESVELIVRGIESAARAQNG